jgi:hypothetical protein
MTARAGPSAWSAVVDGSPLLAGMASKGTASKGTASKGHLASGRWSVLARQHQLGWPEDLGALAHRSADTTDLQPGTKEMVTVLVERGDWPFEGCRLEGCTAPGRKAHRTL